MIGIVPYGTTEETPRRRFPYVTLGLVLVNVLVFLYELVLANSGPNALNAFIANYAAIPSQVIAHGFLDPSLITSVFLHGGFLHLGSNMLFLLAFGDNVEDRMGHGRYLGFYLLWGVLATLTHVLINAGSDVPSLGASGAIAGVLGSYLVLFPRGQVRVFLWVILFFTLTRIPAVLVIGSWFLLQLFSGIGSLGAATSETGGVAVWAHIGGFIAGVVTSLVFFRGSGLSVRSPRQI